MRSSDVATTCFTEIAEVVERLMSYFRFLIIRSIASVFSQDVITTRNIITFTQDVIQHSNAKCNKVNLYRLLTS